MGDDREHGIIVFVAVIVVFERADQHVGIVNSQLASSHLSPECCWYFDSRQAGDDNRLGDGTHGNVAFLRYI